MCHFRWCFASAKLLFYGLCVSMSAYKVFWSRVVTALTGTLCFKRFGNPCYVLDFIINKAVWYMLQSPLSVSITQFLFWCHDFEIFIQNMLLELPQYTACVYTRTRLCSTTPNVFALLSFGTKCEMSNILALDSFFNKLISSNSFWPFWPKRINQRVVYWPGREIKKRTMCNILEDTLQPAIDFQTCSTAMAWHVLARHD